MYDKVIVSRSCRILLLITTTSDWINGIVRFVKWVVSDVKPLDIVWMSNLYWTPGVSSPISTRTNGASSVDWNGAVKKNIFSGYIRATCFFHLPT